MWIRHNISIILIISISLLLLSACSYKEFEDSVRNKVNKKDDNEEYNNPASLSSNDNSNTPNAEEASYLSIGDTITYTFVDQSFQYTLHKVDVVDNIHDLGLELQDFYQTDLIEENGVVKDNYRFVAVDVTVKNIDFEGYVQIDDEPILFIESLVGFKDGIEDPDGPFAIPASYFSEHPPMDQNSGEDYYQFPLAFGSEINATVGWFVPSEELSEDTLFYIIGGASHPEDFQYFIMEFD